MSNRRQFLKACAALTVGAYATPALAIDNNYQIAVDKIWRPKKTASPNILNRTTEWVRMATLAASSHNSQPWKLKLHDNSITIIPDYQRRCPAVDPDDSQLFKSLGCATENLVQTAEADGFHADVQFDPKQDAVIIHFDRTATSQLDNLSAAIINRRCSRIPYDGKPIVLPEMTSLIAALCFAGNRA